MTLKEFLDNFIDDHQNIRLVSWCTAGVLTYADCIHNGAPVKKWFDYEVMRIGIGQMDDGRCYITIVIDTKESENANGELYKLSVADVQKVEHGEWVRVSDDDQYEGCYFCSECKEEYFNPSDDENMLPNFCPNCGAKMNGKEINDGK